MKMRTQSVLAIVIGFASLLSLSFMPTALESTALQVSGHVNTQAVSTHFINVTGEVVDSDGYRILSGFIAVAVNNATGMRALSNPFNDGTFRININVPGLAGDNQTIDIQVLSIDQKTFYGSKPLVLANLNHTSAYPIKITVANPPPNYSWLILIVCFLLFSLILAGYIVFTKWLVAQAVLRRADEIMLTKRMGEENFEDGPADGSEEDNEENDGDRDEKEDA